MATRTRLLLDHGAELLTTTKVDGRTPEQLAAARSHHEIAAMLKAEVHLHGAVALGEGSKAQEIAKKRGQKTLSG